MLELTDLTKHFGGVRAVDSLDLKIVPGQIFGLIGPNGSGKSTTVNLICGVFPVTSGTITFAAHDITKAPPHKCLSLGIARTFQNIRLFNELTVWQNLWVAQNSAKHRKERGFLGRWVGGRGQARAISNSRRWRRSATNWPAISRSASSGASNWRARSRPSPTSCCSTSPRPA